MAREVAELTCGRWNERHRFEHSARSLLLTIIGELVLPSEQPVWTASLLYVLTGLGISEPSARQALTRTAEAGWLTNHRLGRETHWTATPALTELITHATDHIRAFNTANTARGSWDGTGLIAHISLPGHKRNQRKELYTTLRQLGFGNPSPGLWLSPHTDRLDELIAIFERLGIREMASVFIGRLAPAGLTERELLHRGWQLEELAARYTAALDTYAALTPVAGDELLFTYLRLVDHWRAFPTIDPDLPADLPLDWVGHHATTMYLTHRANWKPGARRRWQHIRHLS